MTTSILILLFIKLFYTCKYKTKFLYLIIAPGRITNNIRSNNQTYLRVFILERD